jgi:hypothetical protein
MHTMLVYAKASPHAFVMFASAYACAMIQHVTSVVMCADNYLICIHVIRRKFTHMHVFVAIRYNLWCQLDL